MSATTTAVVELPAADHDTGELTRWTDQAAAGALPLWLVERDAAGRIAVDTGRAWAGADMSRERARALGLALLAATEPS